MTTLYGISNCDTVKKARTWLQQNGVEHQFIDFRKDGIDKKQVRQWVSTLGWETLVNKRSTTWKGLDDHTKNTMSAESVVAIILDHPTLIKRPLLHHSDKFHTGFKAAEYNSLFNQ